MKGEHVTLEPLLVDHASESWPAADDDVIRKLWPRRWLSEDDLRSQFEMLLEQSDSEPYLLRAADGTAAGSSTIYSIDNTHKSATIGWTWIIEAHRRTPLNTEAKLLLLTRCFETLGLNRVQFDVDARNTRSQEAVRRLGATFEGTLRQHKVLWDGFVRDTTVWSITRGEWPEVKAALTARLR